MKREYLLDTHILVGLITSDKKLSENIRNDIEFFQHQYHVSYFSLLEITHLKQIGKIEIGSFDEILEKTNSLCIS